jgi:hypothetical protein
VSPEELLELPFAGEECISLVENSAKWNDDFSISFCVKSNWSKDAIEDFFMEMSLEDTVYEACYENGWVIMNRETGDEYGLVDYRHPGGILIE